MGWVYVIVPKATKASEGTRHHARLFRLGLPVSYVVFALAWLPTHGMLDGQNFFATAAFVSVLVINLGLSVALAFLLLSGRTDDLRAQAGAARIAPHAHDGRTEVGNAVTLTDQPISSNFSQWN